MGESFGFVHISEYCISSARRVKATVRILMCTQCIIVFLIISKVNLHINTKIKCYFSK